MKAVPFVFTTADSTRTGGKEPCDGDLGKRRASVGITKRPMDKHFVRDVESGGAWHALKRLLRHRPRGHYPARVRIQRIDHVGIVVDDLAAATTFPVDIGFELEGEATLASPTVRTNARGSPVGHRDDADPGRLESRASTTRRGVTAFTRAPRPTRPASVISRSLSRHRRRPRPPAGSRRRTRWRARAVRGHLPALPRPWPHADHHRAGEQIRDRSVNGPAPEPRRPPAKPFTNADTT